MPTIYKSEDGARAIHARYREILSQWPVQNRQFTVPTRAGETFIIACGPEDAPPVLLFHGSASSSFMWLNDSATWAKDFRLYAIDLIGEPGLSARTRYRPGTEEHALWLDDVFQALSLNSTSLVGVSYRSRNVPAPLRRVKVDGGLAEQRGPQCPGMTA